MKKFILSLILTILSAGFVRASALTEDYIDISTSYVKDGKYTQALTYINKALTIEPQNTVLIKMKNDLSNIIGVPTFSNTNSFNTNPTFIHAENFKSQKDFAKAIIFYKKTINENPNFSAAYFIICYCQS